MMVPPQVEAHVVALHDAGDQHAAVNEASQRLGVSVQDLAANPVLFDRHEREDIAGERPAHLRQRADR